ncbi:MAG: hypothetical protein ACIAQU_04290 [Phycisphaerales bacterium JB064]
MSKTLTAELEKIRVMSPDGVLRPAAVVEYARDHPESPLHSRFDWNKDVAAERWLLHQAQELIRVAVTYIGDGPKTVRAFVSLDQDREKGGGYRSTAEVAANDALREAMLSQAKRDAESFVRKYKGLEEYAEAVASLRRAAG